MRCQLLLDLPTKDMTDTTDDDYEYCPPHKSTGIRTFAARSKSSARGFGIFEMPAEDHPRQIIYESHLERKTLLMLCAKSDVWNVYDQPGRISYEGLTGKLETHVPDFLAQFRCGLRLAIAVKPYDRVQKINFRATLRAVRKQMPQSFADDLVLVTDRSLNPAEVRNAEFLHLCRRHKDHEADLALAHATDGLNGDTTIEHLVAKAGLGGRGFRAIFRALYDGRLEADKHTVVTHSTIVSPVNQRP